MVVTKPTPREEQTMAQKVRVDLVDDLDGSEAAVTTTFGLDGTHYELDLSKKHDAELRTALAKYVEHARKLPLATSGRGRRPGYAGQMQQGQRVRNNASEVRDWLSANGYEVKDRGRVPADLLDKYTARTPAPAKMPTREEVNEAPAALSLVPDNEANSGASSPPSAPARQPRQSRAAKQPAKAATTAAATGTKQPRQSRAAKQPAKGQTTTRQRNASQAQ
jgi:hypothetical protein